MNIAKVKRLLALIASADAIGLNGELIHNACNDAERMKISEPCGDPDNEVLLFEYEDDAFIWSYKFTEGGLDAAKLDRFRIRLRDHEGSRVKMFLFKLKRIPIKNR